MSGWWYALTGLFDILMGGWGFYIYYVYNLNLASGTNKKQHPYLEWTYESYYIMGPNAVFLSFWSLNYLFDHNAGIFDRFVLFLSKVMILAPVAALVGAFMASSSYGTDI